MGGNEADYHSVDLSPPRQGYETLPRNAPGAHCATVHAESKGRDLVGTFITEVSQDTWIFFPWDLDVAYVAPISGGTD